jgi:hypothetical protein
MDCPHGCEFGGGCCWAFDGQEIEIFVQKVWWRDCAFLEPPNPSCALPFEQIFHRVNIQINALTFLSI